MTRPLLIIGASARAAAFSAVRAGLDPFCIDLFADADLAQICPVQKIEFDYPESLVSLCRLQPPGPWIYTGGLETRPHLIEQIARDRPLLGHDGPILRQVRNPMLVFEHLTNAGIPVPRVQQTIPSAGEATWLVKPLTHVGGAGIRFLEKDIPPTVLSCKKPVYYQEWIQGQSVAAIFVARPESTILAGLTAQLIGESWLHAQPFHYCGSIGPLRPSSEIRLGLERLGQSLATRFHLRGLFGVDGILQGDTFWPVEINPRYTASVEVIERATGWLALQDHTNAFYPATPNPASPPGIHSPPLPGLDRMGSGHGDSMVGKAIVQATRPLRIQKGQAWGDFLPFIADIPTPGTRIEPGQPVLSVFAKGNSEADCLIHLQSRVKSLQQLLDSKDL